MTNDDFGFRDQFLNAIAEMLNRADAIVEKEDLATTG